MNKTVAIIDYGSGNLRSAAKALERVAESGVYIKVTADPQEVLAASHIVLPGVGAFADCIRGLESLGGMRDALEQAVHKNKTPFLGICVGMQMLFETGYEHGTHKGLGWLEGEVVRIAAPEHYKIPHMGWNTLSFLPPPLTGEVDRIYQRAGGGEINAIHTPHPNPPPQGGRELVQAHPLLAGIAQNAHAYFVHSYHAQCTHEADVLATTDYGIILTAIVARSNIMGVQFHPEKSQQAGLQLLKNFLAIAPHGDL